MIDSCHSQLSADSKQILDQPIYKEKVYDSLISMKQNKTPCMMGFPVEFYVDFLAGITDFLFNSYKFSTENGLIQCLKEIMALLQ